MPQHVHLDAMIPRADFATQDQDLTQQFLFKDFPLTQIEEESPVRKLLRKPDFQRETNHWSPEQVVTFIESFLDNQLIPSLILWKSPNFIFIIDGGHRLSALRAWMTDDYGDGHISHAFYGGEISEDQKKIAKRVRTLVEARVGRYTKLKALVGTTSASGDELKRAGTLVTRALDLQWVQGNADVAEKSFFNINSQGTPLDSVESMLIRNRRKAVAIASRAILRAGLGHKYWSQFSPERQEQIESLAAEFHGLLFDPEAESPVRTLDLPLGGSVSPVNALEILIDFLTIAASTQSAPRSVATDSEDPDGEDTVRVLKLAKEVARRIVGNDSASLGLHPAVYFYNERGIHSRYLFLGMVKLITERTRNNDANFFKKFTSVRKHLEEFLISNKSLIGQAFANTNRNSRVLRVRDLLEYLINSFAATESVTIESAFEAIGLQGRILDLKSAPTKPAFSETTKSAVYIRDSLAVGLKCPICEGHLYPKKSVSYDHKVRVRDAGKGDAENAQMVHPYCNTGVKN